MSGSIKSIFRSFAFFQKGTPKPASKKAIMKPKDYSDLTGAISIQIEKRFLVIAEQSLYQLILTYLPIIDGQERRRIRKQIVKSFSAGHREKFLQEVLSKEFSIEPDIAKKLALHALDFLSIEYRKARYQDLGVSGTTKTFDSDSPEFLEWVLLREKFREAKRDKNYRQIIDACHSIIDLAERASFIRIMTPLFHRDAGRAYLKLGDNQKALQHLRIAKSQFIKYRHDNKLSHPDDWLRDINSIEKTLQKLMRS